MSSENHSKERLFDILGLSPAERRVISVSGIAKSASAISRATRIPQASLPYMLAKLERRGLMKKIGARHKHVIWKSDMDRAVRELSFLAHMLYLPLSRFINATRTTDENDPCQENS